MSKTESFLKAANFRHATKEFNSTKKISDDDLNFILSSGKLAPSSFGSEPYKILIISNDKIKNDLSAPMWGQKQIASASHLIVFLSMKNNMLKPDSKYLNHMLADVKKMPAELIAGYTKMYHNFQVANGIKDDKSASDWASKQAYISLAYMALGAAHLEIDSCPMEGFDPAVLGKFLADELKVDMTDYVPSVVLALGYRASEPQFPRSRKSTEETYVWFK